MLHTISSPRLRRARSAPAMLPPPLLFDVTATRGGVTCRFAIFDFLLSTMLIFDGRQLYAYADFLAATSMEAPGEYFRFRRRC